MTAGGNKIGARADGQLLLSFPDDKQEPVALTTATETFQVGVSIQGSNVLAITDDREPLGKQKVS